ncbi:prepilin-type N-terminal cleavage/methylation domain-containing protein [uncultured Deinococcus sp.]|uniref:PilW family protein n=1 Tax=uncultured Deinococcus sp. TaxID=158789 RepID=UPI0025836801|nr:prepilin-type N-terminal cleavage/methylation domain-containing protein [uncultured Deinococcus sp.]
MSRYREGFTLLELLVSMALIGIVMAALFNFFSQTSSVSAQSSSRAELQQEVLTAQQLIAGKLKEAWYIYPAGTVITLGGSGTNNTRKNPVATSNPQSWTTGTDPILAMILPPMTSGGAYRFYAYYPVLRSVWVGATGGTSAPTSSNPGSDAVNDGSTWVLAEYRASLTLTSTTPFPSTPPPVPTTGDANLLTDYIAPSNAAGNTYTMFSTLTPVSLSTPPAGSATSYVPGVTLSLATTRNTGGRVLRLPNATDEYDLTVYPTNLGKIAAN